MTFRSRLNAWTLRNLSATYSAMGNYLKGYEIGKKLAVVDADNYNTWFNLSFYALFAKQYEEAIEAAQKTLEIKPDAKGVYTNLALGYVLNNEFSKAKPIYTKWKDKHFPNDERFGKEVFLSDIKDLEAAGITHPDFAKVRKLLNE